MESTGLINGSSSDDAHLICSLNLQEETWRGKQVSSRLRKMSRKRSLSTWKQREALGIRDRVRLIKIMKEAEKTADACVAARSSRALLFRRVGSNRIESNRIGTHRATREYGTGEEQRAENIIKASKSGECSYRVAEEAVVERLDVAAHQPDRHAGHVRLEPPRMSHRRAALEDVIRARQAHADLRAHNVRSTRHSITQE